MNDPKSVAERIRSSNLSRSQLRDVVTSFAIAAYGQPFTEAVLGRYTAETLATNLLTQCRVQRRIAQSLASTVSAKLVRSFSPYASIYTPIAYGRSRVLRLSAFD